MVWRVGSFLLLAYLCSLVNSRKLDIPNQLTTLQEGMNDTTLTLTEVLAVVEAATEKSDKQQTLVRAVCLRQEQLMQSQAITSSPEEPGPADETELKFLSATQSSSNDAQNAIDGNTNGYYPAGSCTHTVTGETSSWWQGELDGLYRLDKVELYNRGDCCGYRLQDFSIIAYSQDPATHGTEGGQICAQKSGQMGSYEKFECSSPVLARYVRVQKQSWDTEALTLCEVKAYGWVAIAYATGQSSTDFRSPSPAWFALDQDTGTCSQTEAEDHSDPWWQADLGGMYNVAGITITNTDDSLKSGWLRDIQVDVYEEKPTLCVDDVVRTRCTERVDLVPEGDTVTLTCDGAVNGRFVRIQKTAVSGEALVLCEVVVETT